MKKIIVLAFCMMFVSACSLLSLKEKPQVEVIGVSVKKLGFSGGTLEVECNIKNPNAKAIEVDSIGYAMAINENPIAKGEVSDGLVLAAKEQKTVSIPIQFTYQEVANGISSILKQQKLDYNFSGSVKVGMLAIPFSKKGKIQIQN